MAEFKLSRIRFNWKGNWAGGGDYIVDDMVHHKGYTYVALRTHTSADFYNDLAGTDVTPARPKWKKQSEGVSWLGNWATSTNYALGNIVKYGASVYQCTEAHTSSATFASGTDGLVADITKWTLVAVSSADWKYNWTINTLYRINDLVRYNGKVYKALNQHVSAATALLGLEANQSDWAIIADSDTWKGTWTIGTRYKANDIIRYGGIVYKCITGHTSADNTTLGLEEDQAKWEIQIEGVEVKTIATYDDNTETFTRSTAWTSGTRYKKNDLVIRGGNIMKCLVGHVSTDGDNGFLTDYTASKWSVYLPGSEYENVWGEGVNYQPGDLVLYGGYIYKSLTFNVGYKPSQYTSDWNLTFEGYRFRDDWNNVGTADSADVNYNTGDLVRLSGSLYIAIQDSTNLQPDQWPTYWEKVIDGRQFRNSWTDNTEYFMGDIVTWQGTAYVALKYHRSTASASRPDLDVNFPENDYWKIMILGNRTNKLAVKGDLKTFEDQDSTAIDTLRLPIGTDGAALRVTGGMPAWDTIDLIDNVYYVSLDGIDDPDRGGTLNAPFRTVRYACAYLLEDELNRVGQQATIFVQAGDYREILPISIPAKTALVGAELRTTSISPAIQGTHTLLGPRDSKGVQTPLTVPTDNQQRNMFYVRNMGGIRRLTLRGLTGTLVGPNNYGTSRPTGGAFVSLDPGTGTSDTEVWIASKTKAYYTPTDASYNPSTGVMQMTIPQKQFTVSDATYDPLTGIMVTTIGSHTLDVGETIKIATGSIVFRCAMDEYETNHPYPRVSDPAAGADLRIIAKTADTITVNVGVSSNTTAHRFQSADNNGITWKHNLQIGDIILIAPNALTFTCAKDGNTTNHPYPRTTDPAYKQKLAITARSDTTMTVNVGINPDGNYAHTFVSAVAESVSHERISAGRSPYIQGVTTIGNNCIGMKIDGGLHDGGNRSIVANDFTQVLSDGIGYWATNLGRSELVSVFTYYAHIGYLAENGGIMRATNGNNSYGTFGSVAEGFDQGETPQVATVNNRTLEAQVPEIYASGDVTAFAFSNAGETYSTATASVTQTNGTGLDARFEEFRKGAVNKIELQIPDDSTNVGGRGFQFATNSSQGGGEFTIIFAASESRPASKLNGMRVFITEGPGQGQYGYIWQYDANSKTAQIYRDSDGSPGWDHLIPGSVSATVLNALTSYTIEPRVTVTQPTFSVSNNSVQAGAPDIGYSDGLGLWYYAVSGTDDFYTSVDGSIWTQRPTTAGGGAPGISYTGFSKTGPIMVGVGSGTDQLVYSNDGQTFDRTTLPASGSWKKVQIGGANDDVIMALVDTDANIYKGSLTTSNDSTIVAGNFDTVASGALGNKNWVGLAYGAGKWIALAKDGNTVISTDNGSTWSTGSAVTPTAPEEYSDLVFGNNCWVASMANSDRIIYSADGTTWYDSGLLGDSTANDWKVGYTQGAFVAVNGNGQAYKSNNAYRWSLVNQAINNLDSVVGGLAGDTPRWVGIRNSTTVGNIISGGAQAIARVEISGNSIDKFKIYEPGSGYTVAPTVTVYDPEETGEPYYTVNIKNGVIPQPTFYNRGSGYQTAVVAITGNGYAEEKQIGNTMIIDGIDVTPGPGANVVFSGGSGGYSNSTVYRLVKVTKETGTAPNKQITFQISPVLTKATAPTHGTSATIRERYSQCRLTGHDFLDIGTGNFENTNYPALYVFGQTSANDTVQANEIREANGGRVFYTSTDQDGNYRVGELFRVSQAQGGVTLSADFFDLQGLDEIRLGGISVGGTQAVVREFSTETTFVANSNSVVPTQKALKTYIENRFTGGGSNLFTNALTAGQVIITSREINNTAGSNNPSAMTAVNPTFTVNGPLGGGLAALNMFFSARTERDDFNG
tara:strand:- start:297 stop:5897 length:5601 start_codon:yes stop_codon:yes gene_type:complete